MRALGRAATPARGAAARAGLWRPGRTWFPPDARRGAARARRLPRARPQPGAGRPGPALLRGARARRGRDAPARRLRRPARHGARQHGALRGGGEQEDPARAGLRLDLRRLPRASTSTGRVVGFQSSRRRAARRRADEVCRPPLRATSSRRSARGELGRGPGAGALVAAESGAARAGGGDLELRLPERAHPRLAGRAHARSPGRDGRRDHHAATT